MNLDDVKNGRTSIHSLKTREMLMILAEAISGLKEDMDYVYKRLEQGSDTPDDRK